MRLAVLLFPALALAACNQQWSSDEAEQGRADTAQDDVQSTGGEVSDYGNGIQKLESSGSVPETVERLETALKDGGFMVVGRADHQMNASQAGLELGPAVTIIFGKPEAGTPLMQAAPDAALDLPQKMAIYREPDGKTMIAWNSPVWLASRHGIEGMDDRLAAMATALENLAKAAAGTPAEADPLAPDGPGDAPLTMDDETTD